MKNKTYFYYCHLAQAYVKENAWSYDRVLLTEEQFNQAVKDLPSFSKDTNIYTIRGAIQQRVFFKEEEKAA